MCDSDFGGGDIFVCESVTGVTLQQGIHINKFSMQNNISIPI